MRNLLLALVAVSLPSSAQAATYNFYFNNTEQGANSNASPSVIVQDGKLVPNDADPETADTAVASPAPTTAPPSEGGNVVTAVPAMESTFPDAKWKFSLGSIRSRYTVKAFGPTSSSYYGYGDYSNTKMIGSLTYYPIREAGFSFHVGRFLGPELEINPFGVKTGWGKMQFGLLLAIFKDTEGYEAEDDLFGGSSWASTSSVGSNTEPTPMPMPMWSPRMEHKKPINLYTGAQVGLNIVRDLSLNLAYRIAPIQQNNRITSALHWSANYLF